MKSRRAVILGCASVVTLAGCTSEAESGSGEGGESTETPTGTEQAELTVGYHEMTYGEYGYAAVTGTLTNNTERTMSYVQLSAYFYDGNTRIGEGLWNASNLGAGIQARFETTPIQYEYRPSGYELTGNVTY